MSNYLTKNFYIVAPTNIDNRIDGTNIFSNLDVVLTTNSSAAINFIAQRDERNPMELSAVMIHVETPNST